MSLCNSGASLLPFCRTFKIFDVDDSGSIDEVSIALLNTGIPGVILGGEQKEFVTLCSMINGGKPLFGGRACCLDHRLTCVTCESL